ncbi:ABC transporter substrate-binding protein [Nocardiopsis baichengensis]|uniref:ABC transporter substrate-binding protein n=1 Tax=Nocardiopsis baichengensis TaxID=280240 RepID=UPI000347D4EC|nr:ABC transporter substrate-binding protein [Nocardiopsis baichengensis]
MRIARFTTAAALPAVLVLSACGGSDSGGSEGSADAGGAYPVTVNDARGEVTVDAEPERIVSLSPSSTEMLFAIGAGDQVAAVDEHSDYPEEAPTTGLSGFTPNVEAITEEDPDLVVMSQDAEGAADQLESVGVPVLVLEAATAFDDTYEQLETLGGATGHAEEADAEAERIRDEIEKITTETREALGDTELSVYHEVDDSLYSATSDTFIGQVYSELGLENIADGTDGAAESGGYPQLSPEFVVEEDPDLVFLGYPGGDAVDDLETRPAFDTVTAVENGDIVQLDQDISSRWGPRVVDLVQSVSDAVIAAQED